jgi:ribonucleoside-diphosphate reductase alpha chain
MDKLKELKNKLKEGKISGEYPEWLHWSGYQMLKGKFYLEENETLKERFRVIADTLSLHVEGVFNTKEVADRFFKLLWSGKLSAATPILSNCGRPDKGLVISCSGSQVDDSIDGFYSSAREIALLSKHGFGTSANLGGIRPRNSSISNGGTAEGAVPVFELMRSVATTVSQGNTRRGSVASYLPADHDDFWELARFVLHNPDGSNLGWIITNDFIKKYNSGDSEYISRFQEMVFLRMQGKGYLMFVDRANDLAPQVYKDNELDIKASQLCNEVLLHSSNEYTYTCCLSSLNLLHWDSITDGDIEDSLLFLDCTNSLFIHEAEGLPGLEKAVEFAKWSRPSGLGVMGLATYFLEKGVIFDSFEAKLINTSIFKRIRSVCDETNKKFGTYLGESELMKGTGLRMSHTMAVAPTLSTSSILGVSPGIEPYLSSVYTQQGPSGDIRRANPYLFKLLKGKGMWTKEVIDSIMDNECSIQHLDQLTKKEKDLFKTAFEFSQYSLIQMNESRSKYIDQGVSFNLFINPLSDEKYIGDLHRYVFNECKYIKGMYYIRSMDEATARTDHGKYDICESCSG